MKKFNHFSTILLLLIILTSCNKSKNNNSITFEKFPISKKILSFDTIGIPPVLTYVLSVACNSKYLVTLNTKRDKIFQVFSIPELKFVGEVGMKGIGPKEFANPMFFGNFGNNFYLIDNITLKYLSISDTINILKEIKLPGKLNVINEFGIQKDSSYLGTSTNRTMDKEMFCYSKDDKIIQFSEFPTNDEIPVDNSIKFDVYTKRISTNDKLGKIAVLYTKYPMLRIFNSKLLKMERELIFDNGINQSIKIVNGGLETDDTYMFYKEIFSSDKYIYGLYVGKTPMQIESDYSNMKTYLHVWDWNGNPVAEYDLNAPIFKFVILNDRTLIGIMPEDEKHFYTYKLTHLTNK